MDTELIHAFHEGHKGGYALAYSSFYLAFHNGWQSHLDKEPPHQCEPSRCVSKILIEINKIREGRL